MTSSLDKYEIVLYHQFPTRSTRVKWLLIELGIDEQVETRYLDLFAGEHKAPSYLAVNPMGAIPALVLTDKATSERTVITESAAICTFLAQVTSSSSSSSSESESATSLSMQPPIDNIGAMAAYHRAITFVSATVDQLLWEIRMHEQLLPPQMRQPEVAKKARHKYETAIVPVLEKMVKPGLVTAPHHPHFTAADIMLSYTIFWAELYGINTPPLQQYSQKMISRPAFQKVKNDTPRGFGTSNL